MDNSVSRITIESTPSGILLPSWLQQVFLSDYDDNLLIIYPSEAARQNSVRELSTANPSLDSSKHLTIKRLVRTLLTDFRQPNVFDDDSVLLYKTHQECVKRAEKGNFPLLHITGKNWSINKTRRLLSLHQEISMLAKIPRWDSDPGVREFRNALMAIEKVESKTHPDLMNFHLNRLLENLTEEKLPFTLNGLTGIIMLDHPPEFCEVERHILAKIAEFIPIHQLCNPGQFRLGYSGAYLLDVPWCTQTTIPEWVPDHKVQAADFESHWRSTHTEVTGAQFHQVIVERSSHIVQATSSLLDSLSINPNQRILVIDADFEGRINQWHEVLRQMGIYTNIQDKTIGQLPFIQELVYHLQLANGLEAWSFERLRRLANSAIISLSFDLTHPTDPEIIPRPHVDVLENIARSFHVLGGPGAAQRWLSTLSKMSEQYSDYTNESSIKQEETQWWLANVVKLWNIVTDDRQDISELMGCFTGKSLPLIENLASPNDLLQTLINATEWDRLTQDDAHFNACLSAIEVMQDKLQVIDLAGEFSGNNLNFIDLAKLVVNHETSDASRIQCQNLTVCSPNIAFGQSADVVILAGLDAESWTMKPSNIPWLDNATKVKLGLANSDIKIRQGRHHLRHLLNCSASVIVIDTSLDESANPSPPLAEWLDDVASDTAIFTNVPEFISTQDYDLSNLNRTWDLISDGDKNALKLRIFTTDYDDNKPISTRSGNRGRDIRQRSALALLSNRPMEILPDNKSSIAMAFELPINSRLRNSQPNLQSLEVGASMSWEERNKMISFTSLNLSPSAKSAKANTRMKPIWPNLGYRINGNTLSPSIDPRPLPLQEQLPDSLRDIMGDSKTDLQSKVWSANRLQAWLKCPRQAWMKNYLQLTTFETQNEDIDNRTRGLLIHDVEAEIFSKIGVPVFDTALNRGLLLSDSKYNSLEDLWQFALQHLAEKSPWLSRTNAVSVHRCREIIGVTPDIWQEYLTGATNLEPSGKIANYLSATLSLGNSATLVCEWPISNRVRQPVEIFGHNENGQEDSFLLRGRIDRVDEINVEGQADGQRLIIIRDMKTVNGPKLNQRGQRHRKAIFDELQLALYAKAWEAANPNDRVVGVGITEVGDDTEYYVEMDPDYIDSVQHMSIGKITTYTSMTYRDIDEKTGGSSNGFRAWLDERVRTALRVIGGAKAGHVNPTVSDDCKYCTVRRLCPSAKLGGKV